MRRTLAVLLAALALVLAGGAVGKTLLQASGCAGAPAGSCTRVLFVGNSYTYVNDLPGTFAALARAGGHRVEVGSVAKGGATLGELLGAPETAAALTPGRWDVVVLQEQSQVPAAPAVRTTVMFPAVRSFEARIAAASARTVLFLTWAHRDGWPEQGLLTFQAMQDQLSQGYLAIGRELGTPVVPVGVAWAALLQRAPPIALWQDDGSHPSAAGTYLSACAFYAAFFRQAPEGLSFTGGLSGDDARIIQQVAAATVLADPTSWYVR